MKIKVDLGGGLELLFNKVKNFELEIAKKDNNTIQDVISELSKKILEKTELFIGNEGKIRPGIIVLYNSTDWEIYDKENTCVQENDMISFISTLHGG